jgi:hypothetical protein
MAIKFSIPNIPSFTSEEPNKLPILFVPNIPFLRKFVDGDLGIAKKINEKYHKKSLSKIKNKDTLLVYNKVSAVNIGDNIDQFFKDGKFTPPSSISVGKTSNNLGGLDALEKALIQSIFETQKPYITIAKLVIDHFVIIEDIVAHVLGLLGKSKKPRGNRRALGYQGSQDGGGVSKGLDTLDKFVGKPGPQNKLSENKLSADVINSSKPETMTIPFPPPYIAITQSILYSTGEFKENVQYNYIYKDLFEEFDPIIGSQSTTIEDEDDTGKDETIVLGVYNKDWELLTLGQVKDKLPWIVDKYQNNAWPQLKPGNDFDFVYFASILGVEVTNVGGPGKPESVNILGVDVPIDWKIKKYENEGPIIEVEGEGKFIKKGQQVIALNSDKTRSILEFYKSYYLETTSKSLDKSIGEGPPTYLDENGNEVNTKQETLSSLNLILSDYGPLGSLVIQLEGLLTNNFMNLSGQGDNTRNLIDKDKFMKSAYAYKPKKNLKNVWIDPEAEYDMKIIKCDSTTNITFLDTVGIPEKSAVIRRFLRKNMTIQISDGQKIGFFIKSGDKYLVSLDQTSLTVDYFNEDGKLRFAILEIGQTYDTGTTQFPITTFQTNIPDEFKNDYWGYSQLKRYKFVQSGDYYKLTEENYNETFNKWRPATLDTTGSPLNKTITVFSQFGLNNPTLYEIDYNGEVVYIDSQNRFYGIKKDISFDTFIPNDGQINNLSYNPTTNQITLVSQQSVPNQIRIEDVSTGTAKPRIISEVNITNEQLRIPGPLSKGEYGTPNVSEEPGESSTQEVDQIYRFQRFIDDVETFYIIEAVLKSKNTNPLLSENDRNNNSGSNKGSGNRGGGGGSYTWKDIFRVIPKFIRLVIRIATKLIPAIQSFLNLIRNPASFVTDIIIAKLGDDFGAEVPKFGFLSKDFIEQLKQLKTYLEQLKAAKNDLPKIQVAKQKLKSFLNASLLKNYVFVDDNGKGRFILDGSSTIRLFGKAPKLKKLPGITFGLETNLSSLISTEPKAPFKLIFSIDRFATSSSKTLPEFLGLTSDNINKQIQASNLYNANLNPKGPLVVKNEIKTEAGGIQTIEEVSIQYSTGTFKEGVDYTYIYLTEEVQKMIQEADELQSIGDSQSISKAIKILEDAARIDSNNKLIKEKIGLLRNLEGAFSTQPLLDFMLNLVTLPLKVVINIIIYILEFFKSLKNPFTLVDKIISFLSFKWLLDLFNPTSPDSMFAMAEILFDVKKYFTEWLPSLKNKTKTSYDMNEIIKLPWLTLPTFTFDQFNSITFGNGLPILFLNSILCLIEAIINSFIDLIWSIFGLVDPESGRWIVIKPPYITLCKGSNNDLSPKDIVNLLNLTIQDMGQGETGSGLAKNPSVNEDTESSFNFIYDIKTSDGKSVLELDQQELNKFMEENKDLQYTFNF